MVLFQKFLESVNVVPKCVLKKHVDMKYVQQKNVIIL